jgi:hypothetical protein
MKTGFLVPGLLAGLVAVTWAPAAEYAPTDPTAGEELAAQLRAAVPLENSAYSGLLKIRDRDGNATSVPVTCKIIAGTPTWKVVYETGATGTTPAERLAIVHSTNGPNRYLFARAAQTGGAPGEPVACPPDQVATPLAGSDFWLLDLGLDFLHWPTQRLVKTEMKKSRVCQVLESIQAQPPPNGYSRVLSWLDNETGAPILAEAYDRDGKLVKEFSIRSVEKVQGQYQWKEIEIRDVRKRSRTRLELDFSQVQPR